MFSAKKRPTAIFKYIALVLTSMIYNLLGYETSRSKSKVLVCYLSFKPEFVVVSELLVFQLDICKLLLVYNDKSCQRLRINQHGEA